MKFSFVFATGLGAILGAAPALAHTGHIADVAGHNHWLGLAAAGAAVAVAIWAGLKTKSRTETEAEEQDVEADDIADDEAQEA